MGIRASQKTAYWLFFQQFVQADIKEKNRSFALLPLTKDQWRASMSFGIIIMHIFRKNVASHFSEKISWDWCVLANIMPLFVWVLFHLWENYPILTANFVEIGPENDLANFVSVHLTEPCSVNMAEPQQTRRHQAPNHEPIPKVYRPLGTKRINSNGLSYFLHQPIIRTNSTVYWLVAC